MQHEKECKWRLVLCPGSGYICTATTPFCKVEEHAEECQGCKWPPLESREDGIILTKKCESGRDDEDDSWASNLIHHEGMLFFCRVFKRNGIFTVDVVMKGSLEEYKEFLIEAAILDANSDKIKPVVKTSFPPRPLKEDNVPGFCLIVPFKSMSEAWKFNVEDDEFDIEIEIKIGKLE